MNEAALRKALTEIAADLRAAVRQSLPTDDAVLVGYMKTALYRAETALGKEVAA